MEFLDALNKVRAEDSKISERVVPVGRLAADPEGLDIRNILARMGGLLGFGHSRLCPRCWSLLAASN